MNKREILFSKEMADALLSGKKQQTRIGAQETLPFDGDTFDPKKDGARLTGQLKKVMELMRDGEWRTLAEIQAKVGGSEAGVSARLRDLRKQKFGTHMVERRRVHRGDMGPDECVGVWEYRVSGSFRWGGP